LLPITRDLGSKPLQGLMWNQDSPVSIVSLQGLVSQAKKKQGVNGIKSVKEGNLSRKISKNHC
jgi:hypothetical protein